YKRNPDNDTNDWKGGDASAPQSRKTTIFAVQSPFTGRLHYPETELGAGAKIGNATHHWRLSRAEIKKSLESWGTPYDERDLGDKRGKALVLKGSAVKIGSYDPSADPVVAKARERALSVRSTQIWPKFYFNDTKDGEAGGGRPALKRYISDVAKGRIPWTYWAEDDYETPLVISAQSWDHEESGHSQTGLNELDAIVGKGHGFQTAKPTRLIKKIIQLWCPPRGLVLDPYAGSGTTGQAVLELNQESEASRRFILIEQGSPSNGDKYARSLTWQRLHNVITGQRPGPNGIVTNGAEPVPGGFEFRMLTRQIDAKTVLTMKK
ncbi:site-specific DNA-methyltransferase, partial [Mesorhizobium sp. M00.F.Ca.ET.038.03.1.1]